MMSDSWAKQRLSKQIMTMRVVWAAMIMSVFIYGFLLTKTAPLPADWPQVMSSPLFMPLAFAAMCAISMSAVLPKILAKAMNRSAQKMQWTEANLRAARTSKGQRLYRDDDIPKLLSLQGLDLQMVRLSQSYMVSKIIRWALADSAAVMGFVIASQMKSAQVFVPFAIAGIVGMLIAPPTLSELEQHAKSATPL